MTYQVCKRSTTKYNHGSRPK